jgi:S1-C subfamily serine protease
MVPPAAQSAAPAASAADPITERVAWTPSSNEPPVYAPTPTASAEGYGSAAYAGSTGSRSDNGRRPIGPGFVLGAVLASALLASGGTYLAVQASDGNHTTPSNASAVTPAANSTQAPAGTSAPAATTPPTGGTSAPAAAGQANVADIFKNVSPAVVTIVADGVTATDPTTGQTGVGTATGSGIIFDANGLILTNHHVVAGNPSKLTVNLKDGRSLPATIYGIDTLTDLAIVKVDATGLPTAPIGDSSTIQVGQQAIAIGSPLGTFTDSVTSGIISAVGRDIPVENEILHNLIQTDTAINPGNSGGPLLDPSGKVVGINTAVAGDSQGIGFAIPINIAKPLLAQASAGQQLARPWLGIVFETIDPTIKQANSLPVDNGAWIPTADAAAAQGSTGSTGQDPNAQGQDPNAQGGQGSDPFGQGANPFGQGTDPFGQGGSQGQTGSGAAAQPTVVAGSPADKAGLQPGDIITSIDGTTLDASHTLDQVVAGYAPGQTIKLTVLRNGQTQDVSVTLGTRPATS